MTTEILQARGSKVLVSADDLRALTAGIFEARGVAADDAAAVADALVWANLRGVDSHGVSRVPRYLELFDKGPSRTPPSPWSGPGPRSRSSTRTRRRGRSR